MLEPIDPSNFGGKLLKITKKLRMENMMLKVTLGFAVIGLIVILINSSQNHNPSQELED